MQFKVGQPVRVWINSIFGALSAVIVRDVTGDKDVAKTANAMVAECVFEIRFTQGPHRGSYSFVPARDLRV